MKSKPPTWDDGAECSKNKQRPFLSRSVREMNEKCRQHLVTSALCFAHGLGAPHPPPTPLTWEPFWLGPARNWQRVCQKPFEHEFLINTLIVNKGTALWSFKNRIQGGKWAEEHLVGVPNQFREASQAGSLSSKEHLGGKWETADVIETESAQSFLAE